MEVDRATRRAAGEVRMSGGGGLTVGVMCLCTVKGQIYMQSVLNQMCIPSLTQYTQTHKHAHI